MVWSNYLYYPHFIDDETEAQRSNITYPKSHHWLVAELGDRFHQSGFTVQSLTRCSIALKELQRVLRWRCPCHGHPGRSLTGLGRGGATQVQLTQGPQLGGWLLELTFSTCLPVSSLIQGSIHLRKFVFHLCKNMQTKEGEILFWSGSFTNIAMTFLSSLSKGSFSIHISPTNLHDSFPHVI